MQIFISEQQNKSFLGHIQVKRVVSLYRYNIESGMSPVLGEKNRDAVTPIWLTKGHIRIKQVVFLYCCNMKSDMSPVLGETDTVTPIWLT